MSLSRSLMDTHFLFKYYFYSNIYVIVHRSHPINKLLKWKLKFFLKFLSHMGLHYNNKGKPYSTLFECEFEPVTFRITILRLTH